MSKKNKDKEEDCPIQLMLLAETPFEKHLVIEIINFHKELVKVSQEFKWLKRICIGILLTIATNVIIGLI